MVNKTVQQIVERTVGTNFVDRVMNGPRSSIRDNNWDCYSNVVDIIQAKCKKTLNIPMVRIVISLLKRQEKSASENVVC